MLEDETLLSVINFAGGFDSLHPNIPFCLKDLMGERASS